MNRVAAVTLATLCVPLLAAGLTVPGTTGGATRDPVVTRTDDGPVEIAVPGTATRVRLWEQADVDGVRRPHYAVKLDGRGWSRPRATDYRLHLRHDVFDPLVRARAPRELPGGAAAAQDPTVERMHIVQFVTQPLDSYRQAIRDLGATVHQHVPKHAHLVRMTPAVRDAVADLPFVRWVGPLRPADRLEPRLVDGLAAGTLGGVKCNVRLVEPGGPARHALADRIEAIGGRVDRRYAGRSMIEATFTGPQLAEAAAWPEVMFIDRWSAFGTDMDVVRQIGGADYVETQSGWTGQGVRGAVLDFGFNVTHADLQSNPFILYNAVDIDSHGAGTSGIIFGDGTANPAARGLLPDAQGIVADEGTLLTGEPRYEYVRDLVLPPYEAVFHSASVGSARDVAYTNDSAEMDQILFDFDLLHCQSQSNAGNRNSRPQAWAKNIVAVGGIWHWNNTDPSDDCWNCGTFQASIGPASDERIKPDLCNVFDNITTLYIGSDTAYRSDFGGTSGATAVTAGHFGLLFQMWSEGAFGNPVDPAGTVFDNRAHMTTAKALMINTARQYAFSGGGHDLTRTHQGWGRPSVEDLYDLRDRIFFVDEYELLTNLESVSYALTVDPGEPALRATLTWADPPGVPFTTMHIVNDLTLRVTSPGGAEYWGNHDLKWENWSSPGGGPNTIDTVENVFIPNPAPGTWTVEVFADNVVQDGHVETPQMDVDFALVVSGVQPDPPALLVRGEPAPAHVPPATPVEVAATILEGDETLVGASLFYRADPGQPFTEIPLTLDSGVRYTAMLPGFQCGDTPQYYLRATGTGGAVELAPANAPVSLYEIPVGDVVAFFHDNFEFELGWTVENEPGLLDGPWERGTPIGRGDRGDPPTDFDGSGQCFLTDNVDGDSDVDNGITWLISPPIDLSADDGDIEYAVWYVNNVGPAPNADVFNVHVSNDDGANWTLVETLGPVTTAGWTVRQFTVGDFVAPTGQVRVRFEASDLATGSIVEAGIDAFRVLRFGCADPCAADTTGDGVVDIADLLEVLAAWGGSEPDIAPPGGDGIVDATDLLAVLAQWGACP
ncbi:MAG: S8 family serine peptidase [Planctomycetota bacterium]|jgi:hypothetical protein